MECFRCSSARGVTASIVGAVSSARKPNDGAGDVGKSASQFLMLRGLSGDTNEESLAAHLRKVLSSIPLRRVLLARDKRSGNASWGFAFVEFKSADDSTRALEELKHLPTGFKIHGTEIQTSFIHAGVFVPVYTDITDDRYYFTSSSGLKLSYWDEGAFLSVWTDPSFYAQDTTQPKPAVIDGIKSSAAQDDKKKRNLPDLRR